MPLGGFVLTLLTERERSSKAGRTATAPEPPPRLDACAIVRAMMVRAATYASFGPPDVLRIETVNVNAPGRGEVRVKVRAAGVNPKDVLVRKGKLRWMVRAPLPRQTGQDFAGVVDEIGPGVRGLGIGDRVFGMLNRQGSGTVAEAVIARADELAQMPDAMDYAEAAAMPLAAQTALQALRDLAGLHAHHRVLVHGASGGVGTFAIQIAKCLGANVVTTSSEANLELCALLGADDTLDYRKDTPWTWRDAFDAIFDVFGNRSFAECRGALRRPGTFVSTVPSPRIAVDRIRSAVSRRKARLVLVRSRTGDLEWLAREHAAGRLRSHIDRTFGLDAIAEAHAHIETKRTRGKVVILLGED